MFNPSENLVDEEAVRKLELLQELFQTPGWEVIRSLASETRTAVTDIRNINTEAQLHYAKGRAQQLDEILGMAEFVKGQLS